MKRRDLLKMSLTAGTLVGLASMAKGADSCGLTPPQTEGPFYPVRPQNDKDWDLTQISGLSQSAAGEVIIVMGQVQDLKCLPLSDTLVEIWQACASGKYNHPNDPNKAPLDPHFQYWGKAITDQNGFYLFKTILPGAYPADTDWIRPPHIHYKVHKWGFEELTTQLYFDGNKYNATDKILNKIPSSERPRVVRAIEKREMQLPGEDKKTHSVVQFDLILKKA